MQNKKAFSFVEIIITISIIALLVVIWMSYRWTQEQKATNVRTVADIWTLNNSLQTYLQDKNSLPEPKWNNNYFSTGAEYRHDANDAFWVHWFVTQDLLPKKYLDYLPLDPRTNQYYAYWKTINKNFYEVAWVIKKDENYITKVKWNYTSWEDLPNSLIREYNWPEFVEDWSKEAFPYNPEERVLIAKINSFSGTVSITWPNNSYLINNEKQILNHTIVSWDTVSVSAGWQAYIFYSDWSQSTLWDSSKDSKLVFANMQYKQKNNLLTRIQLALDSGTLWTKATKLNSNWEKSDFEVYTQDTEAAVRWTIFGVNRNWNKTKITVKQWTVTVKKIEKQNGANISNISELVKEIKKENIKKDNLNIDWTLIEEENGDSVIKVTDPANPKTIKKNDNSNTATSASSLSEPQEEAFSSNFNFEVKGINIDLINNKINLNIPIKYIKKKINYIWISTGSTIYLSKIDKTKDNITLTWSNNFYKVNGWTEFKKKRKALYLKGVTISSTPTQLKNLIQENNTIKTYLCKYRKNKEILKCKTTRKFK